MRVLVAAALLVTSATELIAQDPVPVGSDFEISSTLGYDGAWSSVAAGADGTFVVVWDDGFRSVRGQRFSSDATPLGDNFFVNSTFTDRQTRAVVDVGPNGDFVVAWQGGNFLYNGQDGSFGGAMLQRFDAAGSPFGNELVVNSYTTGDQSNVIVSVGPAGDITVVWQSGESSGPDADSSIQGRRFFANGNPNGAEFQLNSYTTGTQWWPGIDHTPDGGFIVVWQSLGASPGDDNIENSIVGRRFAANGDPIGGDFQVNTFSFGSQISPEVAAGPSGDFLVVWGNSATSIQGQRFHSNGSPQGDQFQVNTYTTSPLLQYPTIASSSTGEFLVTWSSGHFSSPGPDGSRRAVAAQLYAPDGGGSPDGGRLGNEIVVNTATALSQWRSAVAAGPAGVFTVVWQDELYGSNRGQQLQSPSLIFSDGFESGDVSAWSATLP